MAKGGKSDSAAKSKDACKSKDSSKPKDSSKGKDSSSSSKTDAAGAGGKVKGAQSINVRHILNAKQSTHTAALERLQSGASFADVARELSEDKARQGGALGWKTRGSLLPEFEKVAFELAPSTAAKPVWGTCKTAEGYHVIIVEGRK